MIDRHPDSSEYSEKLKGFIGLVPEDGLLEVMSAQMKDTILFMKTIPYRLHNYSYAPDKWTVKQVFGHLCDSERISGYKALCSGRGEEFDSHKIDGNGFVSKGKFGRLSLSELAEEYESVRRSNLILFRHFPDEAWERIVKFPETSVTIRALGYIMVAHVRHHINILKERYLKR